MLMVENALLLPGIIEEINMRWTHSDHSYQIRVMRFYLWYFHYLVVLVHRNPEEQLVNR